MVSLKLSLLVAISLTTLVVGDDYTLNLLKDPDALCLDGSAAGYYWRQGSETGVDKAIIYFQGGGWCYGGYDPSTGASESSMLDSCLSRSKTRLGSSSTYTATASFSGMLSSDASKNQLFADWNAAYQPYCDGVARASSLEDAVDWKGEKLYFKGKDTLDAMMDELITTRGLDKMSLVVVSGCSAGGHTAYLHGDYIQSRLPNTKVLTIPDAGYFLDHLDYNGNPTYHEQMKTLFDYTHATENLNTKCMETNTGDDAWKCIFPQYFVHDMDTPVFPIQSQYDSWQMGNILRLDCNPESCTDAGKMKAAMAYRDATLAALDVADFRDNDGIWSEACVMHCHTGGSLYYDSHWEVPENSGYTIERAVREYVTGESQNESSIHVDSQAYPSNQNCAKPTLEFY